MNFMPASPILTSGLELLEHGIKHLRQGSNQDLKFAVMHADNCVELVLKEIARYKGIRIIDKRGQSIGYYDCIDKLQSKGVSIPELPDIDLLHTERNSIYHLGSQPDKKRAEWLVFGVALIFAKRICHDVLGYDIAAFSNAFDHVTLMNEEIIAERKAIVEKYLSEAVWAYDNRMYKECVISSYSGIEAYLGNAIPIDVRSNPDMMRKLVEDDLITQETLDDFKRLRSIRNLVVHGASDSTKEEAEFALGTFKTILYDIDSMLM
jgi:uncharacterized protein YutE (UPF0331/DUF86 family)